MQTVSKSGHMIHHFHKVQLQSAVFGTQLQKHLLVERVLTHSLVLSPPPLMSGNQSFKSGTWKDYWGGVKQISQKLDLALVVQEPKLSRCMEQKQSCVVFVVSVFIFLSLSPSSRPSSGITSPDQIRAFLETVTSPPASFTTRKSKYGEMQC